MLKRFYRNTKTIEAGCDEAGRGCLAGRCTLRLLYCRQTYRNKWLDDSKKLSDKDRYELRPEIEEKAIGWAVGIVSHQEIDEINILNASFLAMHRALDQLKLVPELLLIDGNVLTATKTLNTPVLLAETPNT